MLFRSSMVKIIVRLLEKKKKNLLRVPRFQIRHHPPGYPDQGREHIPNSAFQRFNLSIHIWEILLLESSCNVPHRTAN